MDVPICPNCGRVMWLISQPKDLQSQHSFQCQVCHVVYIAPDHDPIHPRAFPERD